jgi:hypothetical protein
LLNRLRTEVLRYHLELPGESLSNRARIAPTMWGAAAWASDRVTMAASVVSSYRSINAQPSIKACDPDFG